MSDPAPTVDPVPTTTLDSSALTMLELERFHWEHAGAKEQAIRDRLGLSTTAYYQRLNTLIDREDALAHDPLTVKRLRRVRDQRTRTRRPHPSTLA
ncbi:MAG: hypothetical protein JWM40_370 [Frankiales bacterium]|nr:hypothetical protein [Frankiales bacterium]